MPINISANTKGILFIIASVSCLSLMDGFLPKDTAFKNQESSWKEEFVDLFKEKVDTLEGFGPFIEDIFNAELRDDEGLKEVVVCWTEVVAPPSRRQK